MGLRLFYVERHLMTLQEILASPRPVLMDGAMGTELLAMGRRPPLWTAPVDDVARVHAAYQAAGACVFLTNSLTLPADAQEIHWKADPGMCMLGSLGPLHDTPNFPDRSELIARVRHLRLADAVLLETCSDDSAFTAARWIREEFPELPVLVSFAFRPNEDDKAERIARQGNACEHIEALGVNCGRDQTPADVGRMLRIFRAETRRPLFGRPNEGTIPLGPKEWARQTAAALCDAELDLAMIGGCCGTTPEHIRHLGDLLKSP